MGAVLVALVQDLLLELSLTLHHFAVFQVPGGVSPPHAFWHILGLATPPGLGLICRLLALGGVEFGWGVGLPEDLRLTSVSGPSRASVRATSRLWVNPRILPWALDSRPIAWASLCWAREGRLNLYGGPRSCKVLLLEAPALECSRSWMLPVAGHPRLGGSR